MATSNSLNGNKIDGKINIFNINHHESEGENCASSDNNTRGIARQTKSN